MVNTTRVQLDPFGAFLQGEREGTSQYLNELNSIRQQRALDLEYNMTAMQPGLDYERERRAFQQRLDEQRNANQYAMEQNFGRAILEGRARGAAADDFSNRYFGPGGVTTTYVDPNTGQVVQQIVGGSAAGAPGMAVPDVTIGDPVYAASGVAASVAVPDYQTQIQQSVLPPVPISAARPGARTQRAAALGEAERVMFPSGLPAAVSPEAVDRLRGSYATQFPAPVVPRPPASPLEELTQAVVPPAIAAGQAVAAAGRQVAPRSPRSATEAEAIARDRAAIWRQSAAGRTNRWAAGRGYAGPPLPWYALPTAQEAAAGQRPMPLEAMYPASDAERILFGR